MLAVVEDEQQLLPGERGHQAFDRVGRGVRPEPGLAEPERAEHRLGHLVAAVGRGVERGEVGGRGAERGEVGEAHLAPPACGRLDRQPGLAGAARADDRDQPGVAQRVDARELGLAPDEAGELGREPPARHGHGRLGAQDGQMDLGELGRGVGAELLGEQAPRLGEDRQRLGPPPRRVQGAHQLPPEPFAQGMRGHQPLDLGHLRALGKGQLGLDEVFRCGQPELLQPRGLCPPEGQVGQGGPPPEGERLP